ncbi:hypothetical protein [Vibrio mediterranei]|uniref:Uncharacterized protein n=1 Tax=Vibrio mediterranei TaxID=689 RepID=A0ABX5D6B8_9VIBR|nr:hypothetical protein [Vibrio mediterranei]MCG9659926.1 hypothetical protein [Vibrio mediterranei]PRQ65137.1 hypothetical protein COR51_23740 [Vibrio mediterranei]
MKKASLLSASTHEPLHTSEGERLVDYRERQATIMKTPTNSKLSDLRAVRDSGIAKRVKMILDGKGIFNLVEMANLLAALNDDAELDQWTLQRLAIGHESGGMCGLALVSTYGELRPGILFKKVGHDYVLQSFNYDIPKPVDCQHVH